MKKITAFVPAKLLADAQSHTGAGISETLRQALEVMTRQKAYQAFRDLRGKIDFSEFNLDELREDREFDPQGYVIR